MIVLHKSIKLESPRIDFLRKHVFSLHGNLTNHPISTRTQVMTKKLLLCSIKKQIISCFAPEIISTYVVAYLFHKNATELCSEHTQETTNGPRSKRVLSTSITKGYDLLI